MYLCKRALSLRKKSPIFIKKFSVSLQRSLISVQKSPAERQERERQERERQSAISLALNIRKPHISAQEPYISTKKLYISTKETCQEAHRLGNSL